MSFYNATLPYWLAQHLQGGPVFDTQIIHTTTGYEFRKSERQQVLYKYKAVECYLTKQQYNEIIGFFNACQGRKQSFRLKDFFDYSVENQVIGLGDDSSQEFNLYKQYPGNYNNCRRINLLPIQESIKLAINNVPISADIDLEHNKIILAYPLKTSEILSISFDFEIKVRFDDDKLNFRISDDGCIILDEINLTEVI